LWLKESKLNNSKVEAEVRVIAGDFVMRGPATCGPAAMATDIYFKSNDLLRLRKICAEMQCNCWRTLFWSLHYPHFSCRSRGGQGAWSGDENTLLCCALLGLADLPSTIHLTSKSTFYEHVGIPGRSPSSVRGQLYALFPQGLRVRAIRQEMGVHLERWCLEADSADAMVGVEQPVAAPVAIAVQEEERLLQYPRCFQKALAGLLSWPQKIAAGYSEVAAPIRDNPRVPSSWHGLLQK
jgi:hypothetical protein